MKRKSLPVACLAVIVATFLLGADFLKAQSSLAKKWSDALGPPLPAPFELPPAELPVPTATPGPTVGRRPTATFTFGDGRRITWRSASSRFRLVSLRPSETVDIALLFPAGLPGNSLMAQSLDGGKVIAFSKSNFGGMTSIRFQAGNQPGLYRVFVPSFGAPLLLQFWVTDARNPKADPPVLNPANRGTSR